MAPRMHDWLTGELLTALDAQTVHVVDTNATAVVLPQLDGMLADLRAARDTLQSQVKPFVEAHPLHQVLTSIPAVGISTEA